MLWWKSQTLQHASKYITGVISWPKHFTAALQTQVAEEMTWNN